MKHYLWKDKNFNLRMTQFLKNLLASCLGVILAAIVLFGIGSMIIAGIAQQADEPKDVKPNTVLHLTFDQPIPERTNNLQINPFEFQRRKVLGLQEIQETIIQAKNDDNIKGIFLDVDMLATSGIVSITNLREAILDFRESGKFVVAYAKYYTQGAYYLASAADKVYINPLGIVDFRGFAVQIPFFKEMLDKIGVDMQIFYAGQFKSATEPYRLTEMSDQNKFQTRVYLETIYESFLSDISESRGISVDELDEIASNYRGGMPEDALETGLIDALGHRNEAMSDLRERLGLDEEEKVPMLSLNEYHRSNPPDKDYSVRDKIAVVYAEGSILDGKGENGTIGDQKYTDIIQDLRRDERVKAIVLRVNSPGGSAMASENIWKELSLARQEGIPVVVSMGDYAASGGYYIASASDSIFAEPKTLTGSIGVFSIIPNTRELLGDKIGITFDSVKTTDMATGITPFFDLTPKEERFLQQRTDMMYETFLQRVAENRGVSRDSIHEIAQGRVWTGLKAEEIGLVDRIGGLEDAIDAASNLAGIETYRLSEYPQVKDPLQEFLEEIMGMDQSMTAERLLRKETPEWYPYFKFIKELRDAKGAQARLPFVVSFN